MPTYQYACASCGHRFEEFQRITADALTECPKCRTAALKRLIGAGGGVIFKGSGFYVNDYARAGKSGGEKSDSSSTSPSAEKSCGSCGTTGPNVCDPAS
ncbi:MAG: zinc ribbon domain-containing protein [Planctomycetes bacterium]|nr:zinc ribbon domain-containing protein [Planctomycetota bacterium]